MEYLELTKPPAAKRRSIKRLIHNHHPCAIGYRFIGLTSHDAALVIGRGADFQRILERLIDLPSMARLSTDHFFVWVDTLDQLSDIQDFKSILGADQKIGRQYQAVIGRSDSDTDKDWFRVRKLEYRRLLRFLASGLEPRISIGHSVA